MQAAFCLYFLIFPIKKCANLSARSWSDILSGSGLLCTLPVIWWTSEYNFFMFPLHSFTFSLILLMVDLLSADLYSSCAIFRADHWYSSLYFIRISSLLTLLFHSFTSLLNQGLLLLMVNILICSGACFSNSFSIDLSDVLSQYIGIIWLLNTFSKFFSKSICIYIFDFFWALWSSLVDLLLEMIVWITLCCHLIGLAPPYMMLS